MRILLAAIGIAAMSWGGYWFVGAGALERAIVGWLEDRRADGWQADVAAVRTRGFPNRFDTTLTGVRLADTRSGIAWTAPFFQILSLSYKPNHVIAVLPEAHSFATPQETIEIQSDSASGSVIFEPDTLLALDRTSFVIENLAMTSTADWQVEAKIVNLATRQTDAEGFAHDIALHADGLAPGGALLAISGSTGLPAEFEAFELDANVAFTAPWDRVALEKRRPQPVQINLRLARAQWGDMRLQVTGKLDVDRAGIPTGTLSVQAQNWRSMLNLLERTGALPSEIIPAMSGGLALLSGMSGNPDHIDATLNFRSGHIAIGPISLGPAPVLRLR